MPEFYGGAPNAFAGGMGYGADQRSLLSARKAKENALAALIERYGPEAADPQSLASLQGTEQSADLHPYDVSQAQRVDAARQGEVAQYGEAAGDPSVLKRDQEMKLQAAQRAAAVLKLVKARGGDLGQAFDMTVEVLPMIGITPDQFAAARESIVSDPDSVDELVAMLEDPDGSKNNRKSLSGGIAMRNDETGKIEWVIPEEGGARAIPGYTPVAAQQGDTRLQQGADRLQQGWDKISQEQAKMEGFNAPAGFEIWRNRETGRIEAVPIAGSSQETDLNKTQTELETADRKFLGVAGTVSANAEVVAREAARALPYFEDARGGILLRSLRLGTKLVPGTEAYDANDALKAIKAKVSIDALQQMRQNSPTGGAMGNVSDKDIAILESALGRLETERDPERMVVDINFILSEYGRITSYARQDAARARARIEQRQQGRVQRPSAPEPDDSLDALLNQYAPVNP